MCFLRQSTSLEVVTAASVLYHPVSTHICPFLLPKPEKATSSRSCCYISSLPAQAGLAGEAAPPTATFYLIWLVWKSVSYRLPVMEHNACNYINWTVLGCSNGVLLELAVASAVSTENGAREQVIAGLGRNRVQNSHYPPSHSIFWICTWTQFNL